MRNFLFGLVSTFLMSVPASADKPLILVELFTSQGCYSCPPADEILKDLSKEADVLPLGLHVDYWDYLGWQDAFAIHKFGERQASYNARIRGRSVRVTPQMVFNGVAEVAGGSHSSKERIYKIVDDMRTRAQMVSLSLEQSGAMVIATLSGSLPDEKHAELIVAKYRPSSSVEVERGENAGKTLDYLNVVESLEKVGIWQGDKEATIEFDLPSQGHYAVFVQSRRFGPVLVAQRLDWLD